MEKLQFETEEIKGNLEAGFGSVYKPFSKYQKDSHELWQRGIKIAENKELMNNIIFCNDILEIPPVKVFISLPENQDLLEELDAYDKKFLGTFFGYIFKHIFEYQNQKQRRINSKIVRSATYYYDNKYSIEVV
ncbi:hypothetical protein MWH25_02400 [Natroniella acetigena]|uniref:hypothetical protein n=1 Tax=Natroniella acetigena TaxID=52004 RepID=UPI00200A7D32|nr:hypothetical protein [Natroniella acetigena]MCK8826600.1 hypothetical protein [Natroniella acetigena]